MLKDYDNEKIAIGPKHIDESIGFFTRNLVTKEPIGQFKKWFLEICKIPDLMFPTAMCLATVNKAGQVSNRIVFCRGYNKHGFLFYTDYQSGKAGDLFQNPHAAATFHWGPTNRSVRIEGTCLMFTDEEADHHFSNLSEEERLAANIGVQGEAYDNRYLLPTKYIYLKKQAFLGKHMKRPKFWGGYTLHPNRVEFWEARDNRLHDRINFKKLSEDCEHNTTDYKPGVDDWTIERLIP